LERQAHRARLWSLKGQKAEIVLQDVRCWKL